MNRLGIYDGSPRELLSKYRQLQIESDQLKGVHEQLGRFGFSEDSVRANSGLLGDISRADAESQTLFRNMRARYAALRLTENETLERRYANLTKQMHRLSTSLGARQRGLQRDRYDRYESTDQVRYQPPSQRTGAPRKYSFLGVVFVL